MLQLLINFPNEVSSLSLNAEISMVSDSQEFLKNCQEFQNILKNSQQFSTISNKCSTIPSNSQEFLLICWIIEQNMQFLEIPMNP